MMQLLILSEEGVDCVEEFDLLDEFVTFGVLEVDVSSDRSESFEGLGFDGGESLGK